MLSILVLLLVVHVREFICADDIAMTSISREISLQEGMEASLRETFKHFFEDFIHKSASNSKTFMYVCDKKCIEMNLYAYGLTSAFLFAVLSDRTFSIYPDIDSPFYSLYEQAAYQWKGNETEIRHSAKRSLIPPLAKTRQVLAEVHKFESKLYDMDFDLKFKEQTIYLHSNYDWVQDIRRHAKTGVKMPWLFMTHASDLVRLIHNGLFQLTETVAQMINDELIQKVDVNRLVCFKGNSKDYNAQVHSFLEFVSKVHSNSTVFYISGIDKLHVFLDTYRPEINSKIVKINKKKIYNIIMENNRYIKQKRIEELIDIHVLKLCETLVVIESPSGILAANLRRREDNLYCYRDRVIFPCTRGLIAGSFRDKVNIPEYLDVNYYCTHSDADCAPANQ